MTTMDTQTVNHTTAKLRKPPRRKNPRRARKAKTVRNLQGLAPLRALFALGAKAATPREVYEGVKKSCPSYTEDHKTIYKHLNSLVRHKLAARHGSRYKRTPAGKALLDSLKPR